MHVDQIIAACTQAIGFLMVFASWTKTLVDDQALKLFDAVVKYPELAELIGLLLDEHADQLPDVEGHGAGAIDMGDPEELQLATLRSSVESRLTPAAREALEREGILDRFFEFLPYIMQLIALFRKK